MGLLVDSPNFPWNVREAINRLPSRKAVRIEAFEDEGFPCLFIKVFRVRGGVAKTNPLAAAALHNLVSVPCSDISFFDPAFLGYLLQDLMVRDSETVLARQLHGLRSGRLRSSFVRQGPRQGSSRVRHYKPDGHLF